MIARLLKLGRVAIAACAAASIGNAAAVTLTTPVADAVITQNDPTIKCPLNPTFGYGYKIVFQWAGAKPVNFGHYHLRVQHTGSVPVIDQNLKRQRRRLKQCDSFVIDSNLNNWIWQVTTFDNAGNVLDVSEQRSFSFAPCRLSNGQACNAPP